MDLSYRTPGKINLYLKVVRRRHDGYHELDTLFMPLPWLADTITITEASRLELSADCSSLPLDEGNICYRAAEAYAMAAKLSPAWHIHIAKNIPIAAGMGGGSSDAAAVLILLQQYYRALPDRELFSLATALGADVPFFLSPALARARGIGEQLEEIAGDFPELPLLIIQPRFPVSAAWAYKQLSPELPGPGEESAVERLLQAWRAADWPLMGQLFHNDLASAVMRKFPLLQLLRSDLRQCGACGIEISGSGPTLFAIFENFQARDRARKKLLDSYPEVLFLMNG